MPELDSNSKRYWFTSRRERRLWIWTLVVVVGIYSTLGLASTLAKWLDNQGLMASAFVICMALVGLTILTQGLKARPGGIEIGVGIGIAVVYLMLFVRLATPERSHLIEYGVVAVFAFEAITERYGPKNQSMLPAFLAILVSTLVGAVDEFIQYFLPSRVFDWSDILFNFLASLMAVAAMVVLNWGRQRRNK